MLAPPFAGVSSMEKKLRLIKQNRLIRKSEKKEKKEGFSQNPL
jgi:hypothetical protein